MMGRRARNASGRRRRLTKPGPAASALAMSGAPLRCWTRAAAIFAGGWRAALAETMAALVAMSPCAGSLAGRDLDAGGYLGRETGDGLGQSGENGFTQARVEVGFAQVSGGCGRVHERGVSADHGGGSMVAVVLGGAGFALSGRSPAT